MLDSSPAEFRIIGVCLMYIGLLYLLWLFVTLVYVLVYSASEACGEAELRLVMYLYHHLITFALKRLIEPYQVRDTRCRRTY